LLADIEQGHKRTRQRWIDRTDKIVDCGDGGVVVIHQDNTPIMHNIVDKAIVFQHHCIAWTKACNHGLCYLSHIKRGKER